MSGCYFEYAQRWPELGDLLVAGVNGDTPALYRLLDALEQRDRDLELFLKVCGGGGGSCTGIYGASVTVENFGVAFGQWQGTATMEIEVAEDSQAHVSAIWTPPDGASSAYLNPYCDGLYTFPTAQSNDDGVSMTLVYVVGVPAGTTSIGVQVGVSPSSIDLPVAQIALSILVSPCGAGSNAQINF